MSWRPSFPGLSERLTLTIDGLCRAVAAHAVRNRAAAPLVVILWSYLRRLAARFDTLATRLRDGRIAPPRGPAPPNPTPRTRSERTERFPAHFGWLIELAHETRGFRSQIAHLLADPDMAALLDAAPQAGRLLRPLCWMMGISPSPDVPAALFPPRREKPSPHPCPPRSEGWTRDVLPPLLAPAKPA